MKIFDIILWFLSVVTTLVFVMGVGFCYWNQSGHTSFNPYWGLYLFAPVFVLGLMIRTRLRQQSVLSHVAMSSGFCGIVLILLAPHLDMMHQYEHWIAKGMPDRHPYADFLLAGLLFAHLGSTLIYTYTLQPKNTAR